MDAVYRNSHYLLPGQFSLHIGGQAYGVRAAIITAWNPQSEQLSPWQNRKRQLRLVRLLDAKGYRFLRSCCGVDAWWEESLIVFAMNESAAAKRARQSGQKAFVYLDGRRVWLVYA
ncbi:DUF3293 domain-containing protein [Acidithiobacillus sp.]|uniref:DUF3293 domain-containing protein n=1 Tax=Acidithiobacillus sp. TaxID=1872118 RepID=UPI00261070EC|nr:DUF3293 domain-containing protein [Acidithiobacillus sp.]MDD2749483.1 DUF3293 domain-containing protein [Acidithiobacillus sp.]MDD5278065.1 DUF3293 domain-containing protein [Acidithiobacillus sp.]